MRYFTLLLIPLILIGCERQSTGAEMLQKAGQLILDGKFSEAESVAEPKPVKNISNLDPTDPAFCTEKGVATRVDYMAQNLSAELVSDLRSIPDPLTRYAVGRRDIERALKSQEDSIQSLCPYRQAALSMAYEDAIRPVSMEADQLVVLLKVRAQASNTGDLDITAKKALTSYEADERSRFKQECKKRRAEPVNATDPLIRRGNQLLLDDCERSGF